MCCSRTHTPYAPTYPTRACAGRLAADLAPTQAELQELMRQQQMHECLQRQGLSAPGSGASSLTSADIAALATRQRELAAAVRANMTKTFTVYSAGINIAAFDIVEFEQYATAVVTAYPYYLDCYKMMAALERLFGPSAAP